MYPNAQQINCRCHAWSCWQSWEKYTCWARCNGPEQERRARPQSTYICRVQSSVWRLPKYWPPTPSPTSECVLLPPHQKRGVHTHRAVRGWGGGQYFGRRQTLDWPLTVYSLYGRGGARTGGAGNTGNRRNAAHCAFRTASIHCLVVFYKTDHRLKFSNGNICKKIQDRRNVLAY